MTVTAPNKSKSKKPGLPVEAQLLDYIEQLDRHRKGRRAVHFRLSLLAAQNRRERHIQAAINTFDGLTSIFDGAVFALGNTDLIVICCGANILKIDEAVQKVRYLFSEDPHFQFEEEEAAAKFCTWYDLETDYDAFSADVRKRLAPGKAGRSAKREKANTGKPPQSVEHLLDIAGSAGMSLADYASFESLLSAADLTDLIRRQPICALTREDAPEHVFDEVYVSIADLQQALAPQSDLTGDPWMFQRLTRLLDQRVLRVLTGSQDTIPHKNISLNLNVTTLLTPAFQAFDKNLRVGARGTILLELNVIDIFSDIGAFVYARDLAQERGYRICIDGLTHLTATFVDRAMLGADLVKIYWSGDIAEDPAGNQATALANSVRAAGPARVVLCRCSDITAVKAGLDLGISMYQGRQVDSMLRQRLPVSRIG